MSVNSKLIRISQEGLDSLISDLMERGETRLVLLGPGSEIPDSPNQWPILWQSVPIVYQLSEFIPKLAERISVLCDLKLLDLSDNTIMDAGVAHLTSLSKLNHLSLAGNALSAEGAAYLAELTDMISLNLDRNWIDNTGVSYLSRLTKLISLNCADTWIRDRGAACLAGLSSLSHLNLRRTFISDLGASSLAALTNLNYLNLSSTRIGNSAVSSLASLSRLTSLELEDNMIDEISELASLENLRYLNIRGTKVQDLSSLKKFLEANIPVDHTESRSDGTCSIDVYGCPLVNPPIEIVKQGNEAILGYLGEIELQGVDRLYEAKVLILGEGSAGKTSLLRRLYRTDLGLPDEKESTKGIDIQNHEFINSEGKPFRLNVWDFGGQQIYHSTHQFFLTKRSLYILVDDTRNDSITIFDKGFKYWLEVIEALSNSCPVLIFQNEKAGRSKVIDEPGIKGRFPNVKEVYRGNLQLAEAASCLAEAICFYVQSLPHVGDEVPVQWVKIRSHLEKLKQERPFISVREYLQAYECYLPKDKLKAMRLSQYFHDLGVFLHFQDDDSVLSRTVILQNEWATEAVFKVLDDEPTKLRKGYFTRADCQRIWAQSTYADMHLELLALM
jgi:internalin A